MAIYEFEGVDAQGARQRGCIAAADRREAAVMLRERMLTLTGLHRESRLKSVWRGGWHHNLESFRINFCRQMFVMLGAGLPIPEAVRIFAGDVDTYNRKGMERLLLYLSNGYSLSASMELMEGIFSRTMIVMIKGGELSGSLAEVFERLYMLLKRRQENIHRLKMALVYPCLLCVMGGALIIFLLYQVLPVFAEVFAGFNAELPWTTRLLLQLRDSSVIYMAGCTALLVIVLFRLLARHCRSLGIFFDRLILLLPVWGSLAMRSEQSAFLSTLAMLVRSGIRINQGLGVVREMSRSMYWQFVYESMSVQLEQGYSLGVCMEKAGMFPAVVLSMVKAGEQSGEMAKMLSYAGTACQNEADMLLEKVNILAEPVIILLLGGITGFIVMSTVLPVLDLMSLM